MRRKAVFLVLFFAVCLFMVPVTRVSAEESVEKAGHITDPEFAGIIEESMANIINARSTMYEINWTVKANRRYSTSYFKKYADSSIGIGFELSKTGKAGIVDMDGNVRYVEGKSLYHSFAITKTYYYAVFVQNTGSTSLTAAGYYVK